jgi:hypothetical protein
LIRLKAVYYMAFADTKYRNTLRVE